MTSVTQCERNWIRQPVEITTFYYVRHLRAAMRCAQYAARKTSQPAEPASFRGPDEDR